MAWTSCLMRKIIAKYSGMSVVKMRTMGSSANLRSHSVLKCKRTPNLFITFAFTVRIEAFVQHFLDRFFGGFSAVASPRCFGEPVWLVLVVQQIVQMHTRMTGTTENESREYQNKCISARAKKRVFWTRNIQVFGVQENGFLALRVKENWECKKTVTLGS